MGCPHVIWFKTIPQDLKSKCLSLTEAVDMVQNRSDLAAWQLPRPWASWSVGQVGRHVKC